MANTFKCKTFSGGSTVANTEVNLYTVPAGTTTVIIGLALANTSLDTIFVSTKVNNDDGDDVFYAQNIPIPTGSTVEIMSGNKIVLEENDSISVISSEDNSLDTILSIMEQA